VGAQGLKLDRLLVLLLPLLFFYINRLYKFVAALFVGIPRICGQVFATCGQGGYKSGWTCALLSMGCEHGVTE